MQQPRLRIAAALDEAGAAPGDTERWEGQTRLAVADLPGQFPHLGMDEEARITAGECVDDPGVLFLVSDYILPERQRHRYGVRGNRNRLAEFFAFPDGLLK